MFGSTFRARALGRAWALASDLILLTDSDSTSTLGILCAGQHRGGKATAQRAGGTEGARSVSERSGTRRLAAGSGRARPARLSPGRSQASRMRTPRVRNCARAPSTGRIRGQWIILLVKLCSPAVWKHR